MEHGIRVNKTNLEVKEHLGNICVYGRPTSKRNLEKV
jgi:hypothetical protein